MNYHNISKDDMKNGDGLRVVLWLSACSHKCLGCHNPITWNPDEGIEFDLSAKQEIFEQLEKDYISGITFSGGDPLHENNIEEINKLCGEIKERYPTKTIWLYTGYTWNEIWTETTTHEIAIRQEIIKKCDVLVDGKFVQELSDIKYKWAGSTNQKIINVQESLKHNKVILHNSYVKQ